MVIAGSYNLQSPVQVRVESVGEATRFAQIVALMESASLQKPRLAQLADRIARPFLLVVLAAAAVAAAWWWPTDPGRALMVAVAVLIAVVDQRRQRRGFTRAGATHKNHQTAFAHHHIFEHGGQIQVFKLRNIAGNHPAHQRHRAALHDGINAKARHPG